MQNTNYLNLWLTPPVSLKLFLYTGTTSQTSTKPIDDNDMAIDINTDVLINKTMAQNNITEKQEVRIVAIIIVSLFSTSFV